MNIPEEAIEAAAEWLPHSGDCEVRPERDCTCWQARVDLMRLALKAAAPHILAQDRAEVWAEGHEDGFWNGRMSSGDTSDVALIGKEHADVTNPYRRRP